VNGVEKGCKIYFSALFASIGAESIWKVYEAKFLY
jgi:hypothetical protein